ncbi:SAM-dependent methyltransferase [Nonomuraea sp. SYSU D8015]|uniref:SAM-dependent methyltransferase n=1 Tax=Nonomuraea sp. SYSU D8015 TaxID=2593644 RepID=UPI0016611E33|nr:SAM-dependent methyltransferase [Nonomuraea sp. SYSU D8015]
MTDNSTAAGQRPPTIDTTVSHSARIWNYWLGGKDNYEVDREVGDQISAINPDIVLTAREDRAFLRRSVRHLVAEAGIRQFLDIGTGLPTAGNTHEIAQELAPESRVVYVDNDPVVLAHAKVLLRGTPQGRTDYIEADLHDPETILTEAARTLDFTQPIAIMLLGIVHFIQSDDEASAIIRRLIQAVPSGSHLALVHITAVIKPEVKQEEVRHWNEHGKPKIKIRTPEQIEHFFNGLEIIPPGIVSTTRWRPDIHDAPQVDGFCGVGRKP